MIVVMLGAACSMRGQAYAAAGPASGYVLTGSADEWAAFSLARRETLQVVVARPESRDGYTAFEITDRADPAFAYYAVVDSYGGVASGQVGHGGGTDSGSAEAGVSSPSRDLDIGAVALARGRYTLTLVTNAASRVVLIPPRMGGLVHLRPHRGGMGSVVAATYRRPVQATIPRQTLQLHVPKHAHVVLVRETETWEGTPTLGYLNVCLGGGAADQVACSINSSAVTLAVEPSVVPGTVHAVYDGAIPNPISGLTPVSFYSAVSGLVIDRRLLAVALP